MTKIKNAIIITIATIMIFVNLVGNVGAAPSKPRACVRAKSNYYAMRAYTRNRPEYYDFRRAFWRNAHQCQRQGGTWR